MISETPNQHHPPQTTAKLSCIPFRFLKPTILFSSKKNSAKAIFNDIKTPDQAKYFRKYFGHKVTYVMRSTQLVSVIHSRKILQKISFDKGICQKDGFKSSFDAIILGDNIKTPERFSKKVLKGFCGQLSLAFPEEAKYISQYLKKNLSHIQDLDITLQKIEQFGFNRRIFDGIQSLQSFSLKFDPEFEKECGWDSTIKTLDFNPNSDQQNSECGWDSIIKTIDFHPESCQQNSLSFLFLLLQKTHLKRLKLNLAPYPLTSSALSYLLLSIEQANIPEWYVKSGMMPEALVEFTDGKDVQPSPDFPLHLTNSAEVIQKIDFFGFYVINYALEDHSGEWHSDECGSKEFSPQILSKTPQLISKSRKVLDITLAEEIEEQISITTLLEKFSSLEGLYIKAPESKLTFEKKSDLPKKNDLSRRKFDSEDEMSSEEEQEDDYEKDFESRPEDDDENFEYQQKKRRNLRNRSEDDEENSENQSEDDEVKPEEEQEDDDERDFEYQQKKRRNLRNRSEDDEENSENQSEDDEVKPEKESEKIKVKDFPWMKNLKRALLSIVNVNREYYRSDKPFEDLMKHLRDYCPTLESLNVYYASTASQNECGVTSRTESAVTIPCKSLIGFSSLQELEINSDEKGLRGVTETLESLKNLRKLRLNFCDNAKPFTLGDGGRWGDDEDIFEGLGQLKEFELFVRPDQLRYEDIPTPFHWIRYLTKNLYKLKNLEVLRVFDSKETQIEVEVFLGFLKKLGQFTSLREIVIHSKIALNIEALEMAACLYEEDIGTVENRLLGWMKSRVNRIIDLNPNLKLVDIRSFKDTKLDFVFYKAK